ncbi:MULTISPECIES: PilN domain-containing protein [unclassified Bacillus (in: firmicutes)]|uniref:PilN domain-containing protein n=1 Tax=unclassified Bacillus (in: firmicutes) TaxID=185979 RepID=UPI0008EB61C6|nr:MULTISPECIES: PilN domain-containing protein [unclassified Bacillus (in: firmicutes)]SFB16256.1 type IV pilus assembly protein PilN [Bacillus sp. UNCCL13]SFQ78184.1 type IV pilus assembly protein PilN [Bacillus sp. cl95]
MLVEINLLPIKERRSSAMLFATALFVGLFIVVIAFFYWRVHTIQSDLDVVNKGITHTQQIAAKEQEKFQLDVGTESIKQLETSIEWADKYPIASVPVMRHLTSLLPERGFIQTFSYDELGTLTLSVQFDTSREAAYFLNRLQGSEMIQSADLNSLTTKEDEETPTVENGVTATSQNDKVDEYIPRYLAEFQIQLHKEMARKPIEDSFAGEGVSGT